MESDVELTDQPRKNCSSYELSTSKYDAKAMNHELILFTFALQQFKRLCNMMLS